MANPRLPDWVAHIPDGGNRVKSSTINRSTPTRRELTGTVAGDGSQVRIIYGRAQVGGQICALGQIGTDEVYCVVWCGGGETKGVKEVYINNEVVSGSITVTHYKGAAGQTADATLISAIAGYADTLDGVSYTVFRIPDGAVTGFPRFLADFEGLLCYDPRTTLTAYTENPALFCRDLITNTDYGLGSTILGDSESADHCDFLLGGTEKRCLTNYVIDKSSLTLGHARILADYADCFLIEDGDGYRLRPDIVSASARTFTDADFVDGLTIDIGNISGVPTSVEARYVLPQAGSETWPELGEVAELAGVALGTLPIIPSTVRLNGVSRASEAKRKAQSRALRALLVGKFAFTSRDFTVLQQIADVITIDSGLNSLTRDVRIIGVQLIDLGLYRVTCGEYSASAYPDDSGTPLPTTDVPVGAIVMKLAGTTPAGWADYTGADGKYIMGAGSTHVLNAVGGSMDVTVSGLTSVSLSHNGSAFLTNEGSGVGTDYAKTGGDDVSGHDHSYTQLKTLTPKTRAVTLIKKTGSTETHLPSNVGLLFNSDFPVHGMQQQTNGSGRLIKADTSRADSGGTDVATITTPQVSTADHGDTGGTRIVGSSAESYELIHASGHEHDLKLEITAKPKVKSLQIWAALEDYQIQQGGIVFWGGASPPANWSFCDGTNGTPDMRDYIVTIASSDDSGVAKGDNTASWVGIGTPAGNHKHKGAVQADGEGYQSISTTHSDYKGAHSHTAEGDVAFTPSFKALHIIQFTGL